MKPTAQTQRHTVIGEFRVDEDVPADVLAALSPQERRMLEQWLHVFQVSRAPSPGPVELSIDQPGLGALMRALDTAAATLAPPEAETIRESLEEVSRMLYLAASARSSRSCRSAQGVPGQHALLEALSSGDASNSSEPGPSDRGRARVTIRQAGAEPD